MSKVDQFESVFKSAAKTPFEYHAPRIMTVLTITDLPADEARVFGDRVQAYLRVIGERTPAEVRFTTLDETAFQTVEGMLAHLQEVKPDLVCTYRSLHSSAWRYTATLGRYLDVLAQETPVPILVVPNPRAEAAGPEAFPHGQPRWGTEGTNTVMAITDHLTGDHALVNVAAYLTREGGTLWLTHVEDDGVFDRYIEVIGKIPEIDTEVADERLRAQLLKEPADYIASCQAGLTEAGNSLTVSAHITMGHHLSTYLAVIEEHAVDLLVLNTKDEDQYAMHGMAYPLVIELRHVPLLLL